MIVYQGINAVFYQLCNVAFLFQTVYALHTTLGSGYRGCSYGRLSLGLHSGQNHKLRKPNFSRFLVVES